MFSTVLDTTEAKKSLSAALATPTSRAVAAVAIAGGLIAGRSLAASALSIGSRDTCPEGLSVSPSAVAAALKRPSAADAAGSKDSVATSSTDGKQKKEKKPRRRFVGLLPPSESRYAAECLAEAEKYAAVADDLFRAFAEGGGLQSERMALRQKNSPNSADAEEEEALLLTSGHADTADQCAASVAAIRSVMLKKFITADDLMRERMAKVFALHRYMTADASRPLLTATAVRFTIQYNLFAGTVANLGSSAQRRMLQEEVLDKGALGSFVLTEVGAGVVSGMIVETLAVWRAGEGEGGFTLHCPTPSSVKNWVCNGLTAQYAIVIARLLLPPTDANKRHGKRPFVSVPPSSDAANAAANTDVGGPSAEGFLDFGPHAFIVNLSSLDAAKTLTRVAMGPRTSSNSLDVAALTFTNAFIPSDAILSALSDVEPATGDYCQQRSSVAAAADADAAAVSTPSAPPRPFRFEVVAQRLLAGRICISGAALGFLGSTLQEVAAYGRRVPSGRGVTAPLVGLPAVADLIAEAWAVHTFLSAYVRVMEASYAAPSSSGKDKRKGSGGGGGGGISPRLAEEIALAKMVCVEAAIYYVGRLKGAIGSWSLMAEAPFGLCAEALFAYKFAEGDTNILVQKVARDVAARDGLSLRNITSFVGRCFSPSSDPSNGAASYRGALLSLTVKMAAGTLRMRPSEKMSYWLQQHRLVKEVAWRHALEGIRTAVLASYPEFRSSAELVFFDRFAEILVQAQL